MDILVLLGRVEPPLIDPCARARTLTHRNSQSPLFFNKSGKRGKKNPGKIRTRERRRRFLSPVPVHRFPWLTSHNLFHVYASISLCTALCCAPSTRKSLPPFGGGGGASVPPHFRRRLLLPGRPLVAVDGN